MKTIVHKADSRGFANHSWLQANHSFSFANYYNPEKMNFGALRVLNDDVIAPSMGFGTHPHDNMEIITIPLSGVLKHRDSMHDEWQTVIPGEVQIMSAGTGLQHSEINGSASEHLSLFQIWIMPDERSVTPRYDQKMFKASAKKGTLQKLVTSLDDNEEGGLKIHQDALISRISLEGGETFNYPLKSKNHGVYVMTIHGNHNINETVLESRDAIGIWDADHFVTKTNTETELLFIEVPMI